MLSDIERDLGYFDKDVTKAAYQSRGYDILNRDIYILQDQVTPLYDKVKEKIARSQGIKRVENNIRVDGDYHTEPGGNTTTHLLRASKSNNPYKEYKSIG